MTWTTVVDRDGRTWWDYEDAVKQVYANVFHERGGYAWHVFGGEAGPLLGGGKESSLARAQMAADATISRADVIRAEGGVVRQCPHCSILGV